MHDDYKQLEVPEGLELCPCCGGKPELWQYSTAPDGPATKVVMCATNEPIGPQDGLTNEGCPLYMPPDCHYRATIREAVKFWNDFSKALTALQRKNRWAEHQVLRQAPKSLLREPLKPGERLVCYCPPGVCQAPRGFSGPCNRACEQEGKGND